MHTVMLNILLWKYFKDYPRFDIFSETIQKLYYWLIRRNWKSRFGNVSEWDSRKTEDLSKLRVYIQTFKFWAQIQKKIFCGKKICFQLIIHSFCLKQLIMFFLIISEEKCSKCQAQKCRPINKKYEKFWKIEDATNHNVLSNYGKSTAMLPRPSSTNHGRS